MTEFLEWLDKFIERRHERKLELLKEEARCYNCEKLMSIIDANSAERASLVDKINATTVTQEPEQPIHHEPIRPKHVPWSVRRAELEREFRKVKGDNADNASDNRADAQFGPRPSVRGTSTGS